MAHYQADQHPHARRGVWVLLFVAVCLVCALLPMAQYGAQAAVLPTATRAAKPTQTTTPMVTATLTPSPTPTPTLSPTPTPSPSPVSEGVYVEAEAHYAVDFDYIQELYPNSVAWLYQPNTGINEPVMYKADNPAYYLRRQFDGRTSAAGAISVRGDTAPDFASEVITLYGRNRMDDTLFGSFSNYRNPEHENYYENNPMFYLLTPDGDYRLDVFAGIKARLQDTKTWNVPTENGSAALMDYLPGILEQSFFTPLASSLPVEGDSWVILTTESLENEGARYVLYARKRPIVYDAQNTVNLDKLELDSRETLNGYVTLENLGTWMSYGQNDPIWDRLMFEAYDSNKRRVLGDGGCGPTAVATAIVNLVDKQELPKIRAYAKSPNGFRFCACSVNEYFCLISHVPYHLTTADEYFRYFPIVVANIATGNNIWDIRGRNSRFGSSLNYLENICSVYDISVTLTYQMPEAIAFLQEKKGLIIACTISYGSPFTDTSHFLVMCAADDEYVYLLDTLRRSNYKQWDKKKYIEIITPGLVRIKQENVTDCNLAPMYMLQKNGD